MTRDSHSIYVRSEKDTGQYFGSKVCVFDMLVLGGLFGIGLAVIFHLENGGIDVVLKDHGVNYSGYNSSGVILNASSLVEREDGDEDGVEDGVGGRDNMTTSESGGVRLNSSYRDIRSQSLTNSDDNSNPTSSVTPDDESRDYKTLGFALGLAVLCLASVIGVWKARGWGEGGRGDKKSKRDMKGSDRSMIVGRSDRGRGVGLGGGVGRGGLGRGSGVGRGGRGRGSRGRGKARGLEEGRDRETNTIKMVENPVAHIRTLKHRLEEATKLDREHKYREAFEIYRECIVSLNEDVDPLYRDSYQKYRRVYLKRAGEIVKMYPELQSQMEQIIDSESTTIMVQTKPQSSVLRGRGVGGGRGVVGGRGVGGGRGRGLGRGGKAGERSRSGSTPDFSSLPDAPSLGLRYRNSPRASGTSEITVTGENTENGGEVVANNEIAINIQHKTKTDDDYSESSASESDGDGDCDVNTDDIRVGPAAVRFGLNNKKDNEIRQNAREIKQKRDKVRHEFRIPV